MLPSADGLFASAGRLEKCGMHRKTPDDALDDRFVEACQMIDYIEYLADILTVGDLEERVAVVDELMKNGKITFLQDYTTRKKKEDMRHERRNDADLAL